MGFEVFSTICQTTSIIREDALEAAAKLRHYALAPGSLPPLVEVAASTGVCFLLESQRCGIQKFSKTPVAHRHLQRELVETPWGIADDDAATTSAGLMLEA